MSTVKSFSVGNGDTFYIRHNSDNFTIIDCHLGEDIRDRIVAEILDEQSDKGVVRFISTHPDEDHIKGLKYLDEAMPIRNFYCVKNAVTKKDESEDFKHYSGLRNSSVAFHIKKGCQRRWMNKSSDERGGAGLQVLWPNLSNSDFQAALEDAEAGDSPNNISTIVTYGSGGLKFMWLGDLETDFMEAISEEVDWPRVHILFAAHHGRASGRVPHSVLDKIKPKIIVLGEAPSRHLHYYGGYNTLLQNSAGDITFECVSNKAHIFASESGYAPDHLGWDDDALDLHDDYYIGTLEV